MLGELVGPWVGNLQGLEAVVCEPTGFGGYIISMLDELAGLSVGNLQGLLPFSRVSIPFKCQGVMMEHATTIISISDSLMITSASLGLGI